MAILIPTVDQLYQRSQEQVAHLKDQLEEATKRIATMGDNWVRVCIEHDEVLASRNSAIEAWKQQYFELLKLANRLASELKISDENRDFWANAWQEDTTSLEKKVRRLKKKTKKK